MTTSWVTAGSRVSDASGVAGEGDLEHAVVDEEDMAGGDREEDEESGCQSLYLVV